MGHFTSAIKKSNSGYYLVIKAKATPVQQLNGPRYNVVVNTHHASRIEALNAEFIYFDKKEDAGHEFTVDYLCRGNEEENKGFDISTLCERPQNVKLELVDEDEQSYIIMFAIRNYDGYTVSMLQKTPPIFNDITLDWHKLEATKHGSWESVINYLSMRFSGFAEKGVDVREIK